MSSVAEKAVYHPRHENQETRFSIKKKGGGVDICICMYMYISSLSNSFVTSYSNK